MRVRHAALLFTGLVLALLVVDSSILVKAQSPPPLPMLYAGNVTLNGSPAPDGLNVTAVDNSVVVGSTLTSGGAYSLTACFPQNCNSGDTLSFMLNGQLTAAETISINTANRGSPQTQDLSFTGTLSSAQATTTQTTMIEVSTTATPEFPTVALSLLAALGVAFALIHKKTRD
jgi:hypothetical protein